MRVENKMGGNERAQKTGCIVDWGGWGLLSSVFTVIDSTMLLHLRGENLSCYSHKSSMVIVSLVCMNAPAGWS